MTTALTPKFQHAPGNLKKCVTAALTHEFQHVPVEDVVVGEALAMEHGPEELAEEGVVWPAVERQGPAALQVGREFTCREYRQI